MFQNGVNRKLDSKSLDDCVGIQVLLGTNGDRPGNNYFRSVSPSIPALLPKIPSWFFFQVPLMLCTYTRTFLQNNNLLFRTQRYEIGQWSIETLKDSGTIKAFIHDMWQIYGRNWIRFDQNELAEKKNQDFFTIFPDFISIHFSSLFSGLEKLLKLAALYEPWVLYEVFHSITCTCTPP